MGGVDESVEWEWQRVVGCGVGGMGWHRGSPCVISYLYSYIVLLHVDLYDVISWYVFYVGIRRRFFCTCLCTLAILALYLSRTLNATYGRVEFNIPNS